MHDEEAYVTVALNDNEAIGAIVLAKSLRQSGTIRKICALVDNVKDSLLKLMDTAFDCVKPVLLDDVARELLRSRPDLTQAVLKLQCWRLAEYRKCVYLDPACLSLQNTDELFQRDDLSAAPDTCWPDHFNAGVFVFCPSEQTYSKLLDRAAMSTSVDVSFQGILNSFYSGWSVDDIGKHLPFIYNVTPNVFYSYQPAVKSFKENVKIVQFSHEPKPWNTSLDIGSGHVDNVSGEQQHFYSSWWKHFNAHVKPLLDASSMQCIKVSERIQLMPSPHEQTQGGDQASPAENQPDRRAWETGQIDFMGRDAFDNIQKMLDKAINE